jgi:hypothetical protein
LPIDTTKPVFLIAQFKQDRSFIDRSRDITLTLDKKSGEEFLQKFDHFDSMFCVFFKMTHPESVEKDIDVVLNLNEQSSKEFVSNFGQGDMLCGVIFKSAYENDAIDRYDASKTDTNGAQLNDKQITGAARWSGNRRAANRGEGRDIRPDRGSSQLRNILGGERIVPLDQDKGGGS